MRGLLLSSLVLLTGSAGAAVPLEVLVRCAAGGASGTLEQVESKCPGTGEALRRTGTDRLLNAGSRKSVSPKTLDDLADLLQRYDAQAISPLPDIRPLGAISAEVLGATAPSAGETWWDRLKDRARAWLRRHAADPGSPWNRWLERLADSNAFLLVVGYLCVGLVILTALAVIFNELKAAGILRRPRRSAGTAPSPMPASQTGDAIPAAASAQLLQRLIERLRQTGRLHDEGSLTHREVARRAELDSDSQRAALASIAGYAEVSVYGPRHLQTEPDAEVLEQGGRLLQELTPREGR